MQANNIKLLPHNEEAYIKLKDYLKTNQLVAINHATGTGKSFIVLKYLYENRNKRILFLSPSYPINEQLVQEHMKELGIDISEFNKLDTLIYRSLLKMDMNVLASKYDIIVLDEYHRCGAKKWGIKVNELLSIIKNKYPNVKVIGTTATEIRYLDNERNMNNILFDGVCASTLTLADAMLKGILPVPIYINSVIELNEEYEKLISKVYSKSLYDTEREYYLNLIKEVRNQIDEIISKEEDIRKYIKKDGKHLIFSSTIESIKKNQTTIRKLLNCKHDEYVVHSRQTKEKNSEELKKFRYSKNPSTLYCINILNEGVHVKGVDSIFMLRHTISPIIFFQQLGRLLSYSRRKDQVIVFDLVNNIRKSPYIYKLYIDLYKRANELVELDSNNKERYLTILKRFKIVDTASKIYEKLDIIKKALSKENLYTKRIDIIIEILKGNISVNEIEEKMAKLDLFKYYKFITLEQFKKIKEIDNITKPSIFNLSDEEFHDILHGEENIYNYERKKIIIIIDKINMYYELYGIIPSILGKSKEEQSIAKDLIKLYDGDKIDKSIFENKNTDNLSEYEKIVYRIADVININKLYNEIDQLIDNNNDLSSSVLSIISSQTTIISKKYFDKIIKYAASRTKNEINDYDREEEISEDEKDNLRIKYTEDFEEIAKECMIEIKKYNSIEDYLLELSEEIINYINENKRMPSYYKKDISNEELIKMRTLYVKKMVFYHQLKSLGYINMFDEIFNSVQIELAKKNKERILEKLIEFLKSHNGDIPSLNIDTDRGLALEFNRIKKYLDNADKILINSYRTSDRTREVVIKYITFVKKNKRYPLNTSTDEEEIKLLNEYIRNEIYFDKEDKKILNSLKKIVSTREAMQNAYAELLKQKKRR